MNVRGFQLNKLSCINKIFLLSRGIKLRKFRLISRVSLFLLAIFTLFLTNHPTEVQAVSLSDLRDAADYFADYDGIKWTEQTTTPPNQVGKIPINNTVSLDYTFGSARNMSGKVLTGGDTTITQQSVAGSPDNGIPTIVNSKMNVFIENNGKYYSIIHQPKDAYIGTGGNPGDASGTSIDYALLTGSSNPGSTFTSSMNLLMNSTAFDGKTAKLFYTGQYNNRPAFRLVGYYGKQNLFYELLLRAAPDGAPVVQRELYVYNSGRGTPQFQTFFGEDTDLTSATDGQVDNVPIYAIGGGKGLYIKSSNATQIADPASKLYIDNNIDGGFKDFMGRVISNGTDWSVKGKQNASSSDITNPKLGFEDLSNNNNGDTANGKDQNLLKVESSSGFYNVVDGNSKQNTAYSLRWPNVTLSPQNNIAHFSSNLGAMLSGLTDPAVTESVNNETSTDGLNHVGDNLTITFTLKNNGYNSKWVIDRILDSLPQGLTLTSSVIASSGNTIDGNPNESISDSDAAYQLTIGAKINSSAPSNNGGKLVNTGYFTGHTAGDTDTKTISASANIPVQVPKFNYRFQNFVRNETTDPNGDFTSKATAKKDNIIDYKVDFNSTGSDSLKNSYFYDVLPNGLELVPNSFTLNGSSITNSESGNNLGFMTGALNNNTDNIINFKAKVTSPTALTAPNTAQLTHITTSQTESVPTINAEEPAIVDIQTEPAATSFNEVPSNIDFGSINSLDLERILPNKSTTGKLRVTHGSDTQFGVNVSYDNNGSNSIANNGQKLVQDNGDSLLFNQADTNNWAALSPEETPIKTDGFSGSYTDLDLTKYVGSDKWKLRVPAATKAGQYNGQITWSIADTPQ